MGFLWGVLGMRIRELPPLEYLHARLAYDTETGNLIWRDCPLVLPHVNKRLAGRIAGCRMTRRDGIHYRSVGISGTLYRAHRIAYAMHHGVVIPGGMLIDHVSGDPLDNRPGNLRLVDAAGNCRNVKRAKNNTSGATGVDFRNGRWRARIRVDRKLLDIGTYATFDEAVTARREAEVRYGFHPNHGTDR